MIKRLKLDPRTYKSKPIPNYMDIPDLQYLNPKNGMVEYPDWKFKNFKGKIPSVKAEYFIEKMKIEDAKASNEVLAPVFDITYYYDSKLTKAMKNAERMLYTPPDKEEFQDRMDNDLRRILSRFDPELYHKYLGEDLKQPLKYKKERKVLEDPEKDSVFRMNTEMCLSDQIQSFKYNKSTYIKVPKEVSLTSLKDEIAFRK